MKAFQEFNSLAFLVLAIIASVLSCGVAETQVDIRSFCETAQDKDLCNSMVSGATKWHDAISNAKEVTLSLAEELESKSDSIALSLVNLQPGKRDSIQNTCNESFETVIDILNEGQTALTGGDHGTLKTKLSAALDTKCVDELSNANITFPLANMAKELDTKVSICLAKTAQPV